MARVHKKNNGFTIVPNELLNNPDISLRAKGLYSYINSKPDAWDFSAERIANDQKEGVSSVKTALRELERHGYLLRVLIKENGFFKGYDYNIYDKPQNTVGYNSVDGKTVDRKTVDGKLTDISNKEESNKEISNTISSNAAIAKTKKFDFKSELLKFGVDENYLNDWMSLRRKNQWTESVFKLFISEVQKTKITVNEAVKICAENSWKGFRKSYYENLTRSNNGKQQNTNSREQRANEVAEFRQRNRESIAAELSKYLTGDKNQPS